MIDRLRTFPGITRRGLLVGAGLAAAPFVVRSRPANIDPLMVPEDRLYPRPDLLVHPRALQQALEVGAQPPKVLAATSLATYRDGHIPAAIHVWWQDTMELNSPFYGSVLKPEDDKGNQGRRVRFLERLGVTTGDWFVVYGDRDPSHAARVCWFLRFLGYDARVLDGGYAGWLGIDATVTTGTPDVAESSNPVVNPTRDFYLFAVESIPFLADSNTQFVDLRNANEVSDGPSAGRAIPEAVSFPRSSFVSLDGLLLAPDALDQLITAAGVDLSKRHFLVAPTGVDAAVAWLALTLLGAATVTIIDGGWRQWLETPDAPVVEAALWSQSHQPAFLSHQGDEGPMSGLPRFA
jgi:thiosulfate/3-mercaptopyruvate sulfurtransferase